MRIVGLLLGLLVSAACHGAEGADLSAERIKTLVAAVNDASNRMMLKGSSVDDVDALFSMYADDFVYVHEAYGGQYPRERLYSNAVNNMKAGRYNMAEGRYKLLNVIAGLNAAAVERLEVRSGKVHLSVFEFKGDKVSKVVEYWK